MRRTAFAGPGSIVNCSRAQSAEIPRRLCWAKMRWRLRLTKSQVRSRNASRPMSWRLRPSSASWRSISVCTAMAAWSTPGSQSVGRALHAPPADQDVLDRVHHGVAEVQLTRQVGRRHDDGVGIGVVIDGGRERAGVLPAPVGALLNGRGVVRLRHLFASGHVYLEVYEVSLRGRSTGQ